MTTQVKDLVDVYISGFVYEVTRELNACDEIITPCLIGEKIEENVIAALKHECKLPNTALLSYVAADHVLKIWYETNINRYSDYFLEVMPHIEPYINDPDKYANIWGNLASQMIGAIYGNIRENGL